MENLLFLKTYVQVVTTVMRETGTRSMMGWGRRFVAEVYHRSVAFATKINRGTISKIMFDSEFESELKRSMIESGRTRSLLCVN